MRRWTHAILITLLAALAAAGSGADADSDTPTSPLHRAPMGSIARQRILAYRLQAYAGEALTASLDHSRQEWQILSPDQRDRYRKYALAFLKKNPAEQQELLAHYDKLMKMSARRRAAYARRAQWVRAVVNTLTPEQRQTLSQLPPAQRAKRLIQLRDALIREGTLTLEPASQPSSSPVGD